MKNQGPYPATLFITIAQSNLIGVAFGYWIAAKASNFDLLESALVFTFWLAVSWWVWRWARGSFWPEDFKYALLQKASAV